MTRLPTRDWYTPGEAPWDGHDRRRNRDLPHPRGDGGHILSFLTGAVLMLCAVLVITGGHL